MNRIGDWWESYSIRLKDFALIYNKVDRDPEISVTYCQLRIILLKLNALDYKNEKYRFPDVKLANENEIEEFWCRGRK